MRPSIRSRLIVLSTLASLAFSTPIAASGKHASVQVAQLIPTYHSIVPLGAIIYELKPAKRSFFVEADAVGELFEGMQVRTVADQKYLTDSFGNRVERYPDHLVFRISTGQQIRRLQDKYREPVNAPCDLKYFVNHLQFRLKIFRGLRDHALAPDSVSIASSEMKGQPSMYEVSFAMKNVRLEDRVVLEVLSPEGERIGKFHLDLY